ncbi:uncharacterized protein LOC133122546 [Conger conger]|uniref:uncharacterized protein LOC133122546 n=1 Tax=Conger conger TaxID=82655 RepID=UPI002A5AA4D1|nr:uncharacterized protein LOC133122546 [Conger conger]
MSTDQQELIFESFLKKRKDKMKLRWVRYWFRLQNTCLFFYTEKHGCALHLRGQYYIYMVQSVREVTGKGSKPFAFEITMKNGKTKLLAAETVELRHAWVSLLWKAMQLPGPGRSDSACVWDDVADLKQRAQDSLHCSSDSDSELNLKGSGHVSSPPTPWDRPPPSQGPLTSAEKHTPPSEEDRQQEMDIYDIPPSNKKAGWEDVSEGIYDVPTSWLTNMPERTPGAPAEGERSPDSVTLEL